MAKRGREVWNIQGKDYEIDSSYYLGLPEGLQYTIEVRWDFKGRLKSLTREEALTIALPVMQHAVTNDLYRRSRLVGLRGETSTPNRIGVVLYERENRGTRGYRVALPIQQLVELARPSAE